MQNTMRDAIESMYRGKTIVATDQIVLKVDEGRTSYEMSWITKTMSERKQKWSTCVRVFGGISVRIQQSVAPNKPHVLCLVATKCKCAVSCVRMHLKQVNHACLFQFRC